MIPNFVRTIDAVQQENAVGFGIFEHVELLQESELVAGDEIGIVVADQVRRVDRFGAKAQVRNGHGAGFLGVVDEIALREIAGFLADDLGGVLVGAHCAISAQTEEYAAHGIIAFNAEMRVVADAFAGQVIFNAHGKVVHGAFFFQFIKDALDHGGSEFLGRKAKAAANHDRGCL